MASFMTIDPFQKLWQSHESLRGIVAYYEKNENRVSCLLNRKTHEFSLPIFVCKDDKNPREAAKLNLAFKENRVVFLNVETSYKSGKEDNRFTICISEAQQKDFASIQELTKVKVVLERDVAVKIKFPKRLRTKTISSTKMDLIAKTNMLSIMPAFLTHIKGVARRAQTPKEGSSGSPRILSSRA